MMNLRKQHLAVAVAGAFSLMVATAQAADFNATTTLQNTLTVVSLQDFDIGTVFASSTANAIAEGVGALEIAPDGTVGEASTASTTVSLISLGAPTPAQGSVDMAADFDLQLPNTSGIDPASFTANSPATLGTMLINKAATPPYAELTHESGDTEIPSLFLVHFLIEDVSGGISTAGATNTGAYAIEQEFGETTYVFNVGATLTTEPGNGTAAQNYEEGIYSGTFEITASY